MIEKSEKSPVRYVIWSDFLPSMVWPVGSLGVLAIVIAIVEHDPSALLTLPAFGVVLGLAWWRCNGSSITITADGVIRFLAKSTPYPYTITIPANIAFELDWQRSERPWGRLGGWVWFKVESASRGISGWTTCGPFRDPKKVFDFVLRVRSHGLDDAELVANAEKEGWRR